MSKVQVAMGKGHAAVDNGATGKVQGAREDEPTLNGAHTWYYRSGPGGNRERKHDNQK